MTNHTAALIARWFGQAGGDLLVGGMPIGEIVHAYGTPSFIYDTSVLERKWNLLRSALPDRFDIHYSIKANPLAAIVELFVARGAGLEVASAGELQRALRAGCPPEKIFFAGPAKSNAELELAIEHGVGEVHVESPREAERLAAIARRRNAVVPVAIRVNPGPDSLGGAMRMGGKPSPFGIDEEQLESVVERLHADPVLALRGIHVYPGTQILDVATLLAQYRHALAIARRVATWTGRPLATLDLGGGLGVPYFSNESELDMDRFAAEVRVLGAGVEDDESLAGTRFILEPGRYLVAEAGIYVARVVDIKVSRGKKYLVLDGGMNHHLAASGNLGQVIKRNFPVAILNKLEQTESAVVDVAGPLCTPLDVLGRGVHLPAAEEGDLIGIFQSGAYARSASPTEFLSRPTPAEILVSGGAARLIRTRGTDEGLAAET